jgi:hypothetical protein
MSDQDKSPELYGGHEPAPSTSGPTLTGAGQIGFFTTAPTPFILLNTVANPGPGAIDFEEATIRVTGVHNVDASFFVL